MSELNEVWAQDIAKAIEYAKETGRFEVADYLELRAANDSVRSESIKWLFDTVLDITGAFNRHGANIKIEQNAKHRFKFGKLSLSGSILELRQGIRCLSIEAGWTRSPSDGIMRQGALAHAKISHFGFSKHGEELALIKFEDKPQWFTIDGEKHRISFNVKSLKKHFEVFLG